MPQIHRFACTACDFEMPVGWGGHAYVSDDAGRRVVCPHPGEAATIIEITGMSVGEAMDAGRTGFHSDCVCLVCLEQFNLDLKRDRRRCPKCSSADVKSTSELVDQPCPACHAGTVKAGSPVRWRLDPDRASLPVPQVVKDLVDYIHSRSVPPSLQPAHDAALRIPGAERHDLATITMHLLGWWKGSPSQGHRVRPTLGPYDLKWPWVKAFRLIVESTPELDRLIRWEDGLWHFRDELSADERRGIANYVREHWAPPMWA